MGAGNGLDLAALRHGAFGHNNKGRGGASRHALFDMGGDLLKGKGHFGNQDHVGITGQAAVEGDPSGVAAHDFQDHHPLVAGGGGVEAVKRVGHALHRRIETEGGGGGGEIVVDRLRHADARHAVFKELVGGGQGTIAADTDQRADAEVLQSFFRLVDDRLRNDRLFAQALLGDEAALVGGADDRAAGGGDPLGVVQGENTIVDRREESLIAVDETEDLPAQIMGRRDRRADNRVQAGTVPAAGEHADTKTLHGFMANADS